MFRPHCRLGRGVYELAERHGVKSRELRRKVLIGARLRQEQVWSDIVIRNVSSRGMLLQCAVPPTRGTYVEVCRGRQIVVGRVAWSHGDQFGIRSQDKINIAALAGEPDRSQQNIGDVQPCGRRSDRRAQLRHVAGKSIKQQAECSRWWASTGQFAFLIVLGALAATAVAGAAERMIAAPVAQVVRYLPR